MAAVICAGKPVVKLASKIAVSAYNTGETMPVLVVSPVVTMEIGVTSEPVPAVVGIRISGKRGPWVLFTP